MQQDTIINDKFIQGPILGPLLRFALPVLLALFLQVMYSAVDMWVVGRFAQAIDVSAVSTGSQVMITLTMLATGLAMGITVLLGQRIGQQRPKEAGKAVGAGIVLFLFFGAVLTLVSMCCAAPLSSLLNAPEEAFSSTVEYVRICCGGFIFIVGFNVIGAVFRGIGDSKMPLITVAIATVVNIVLDMALVWGLGMGAKGAAIATVAAQAISVIISVFIIRRKKLPFEMHRQYICWDKKQIGKILRLGTPIALQDLLVNISFLVLLAIVNELGLTASAGMGVAERLCGFIMLVPSAFAQSMSAFVAHNIGAGKPKRARRALLYGIAAGLSAGVIMGWLAFFHGDMLALIFDKDTAIAAEAFSYLRAYAIDTLMTPFLFCFIGYFNGCGKTLFVMLQGIAGAFFVRIPVAWAVSTLPDVTLFQIGLATPASTVVQIIICTVYFVFLLKRERRGIRVEAIS